MKNITLQAAEISKILAHLPGCMGAPSDNTSPCGKESCLQCRARAALMGEPPDKGHSVVIGSIISHRTKQGMVEIVVDDNRLHLDVKKAREIYEMLGGAIEAAISDQIVFDLFRDKGIPESHVMTIISDLRERRQGSKGTVYAS